MNTTQEPKYKIENGKLHNRQSGEQIPDDEPVFVLRARDSHAVATLSNYLCMVKASGDHGEHFRAVRMRLDQFEKFSRENRDRMKLPDTVITTDWDQLKEPNQ